MENTTDSGIVLGKNTNIPVVEPTVFHAYVTTVGMIICFDEGKDKDGKTYWDIPLVLETVAKRDPNTGEIQKSQGFRPLVPLSKGTKCVPVNAQAMFAIEIFDETIEKAYRAITKDIRAQLSGIVLPKNNGVVEENGSSVVG